MNAAALEAVTERLKASFRRWLRRPTSASLRRAWGSRRARFRSATIARRSLMATVICFSPPKDSSARS